MRLVFVNYSSPRVRHVSGTRVWKFGEAVAMRGHRVVIITSDHGMEGTPGLAPADLPAALERHDWTRPFHLLAPGPVNRWLQGVAEGTLPKWMRAIIITRVSTTRRGKFHPWVQSARRYFREIRAHFAPDLAWTTFGNVDSLHIGQDLAHFATVPWIVDLKDCWDPFVPAPFRSLIARRFRDAAWITSNSDFSASAARPWFPQQQTTIYSGVDPEFRNRDVPRGDHNEFRIMLSGALYQESVLQDFLTGLRHWLTRMSTVDRARVTVAYAGTATKMFARNAAEMDSLCRFEFHDYLPFPDFMELIRTASVNAYLWHPRTFHHKLIELLTCNRPIIAFPSEHAESKAIARQMSGELICCQTPEQLAGWLDAIWRRDKVAEPGVNLDALRLFTWQSQAERLLQVFHQVLSA